MWVEVCEDTTGEVCQWMRYNTFPPELTLSEANELLTAAIFLLAIAWCAGTLYRVIFYRSTK